MFVARASELPGCMAHGDTPAAALESCFEAIDLWLETALEHGREIPEPRGRFLPLE